MQGAWVLCLFGCFFRLFRGFLFGKIGLALFQQVGQQLDQPVDRRGRGLRDREHPHVFAADDQKRHRRDLDPGAGAGIKITPVAFLVIRGENVRMLPVAEPASTSVDRLIELLPDLLEKGEAYFAEKKAAKEAEKAAEEA